MYCRKIRHDTDFTSRIGEKLKNLCYPDPLKTKGHVCRSKSLDMLTHSIMDGESHTDLTSNQCELNLLSENLTGQ